MNIFKMGVCAVLAILILGCEEGKNPSWLNIQPTPKRMRVSGDSIKLPNGKVVLSLQNDAGDIRKNAKKILIRNLKAKMGIAVSPKNSLDDKYVIIIKLLPSDADAPQESYSIKTSKAGSNMEITIKGEGAGVIYGVFTLLDILEQTTAHNGGVFSVPMKIDIQDYPSIPLRMRPRICGYDKISDSELDAIFEKMSRQRLNAGWHRAWLPHLKQICDRAHGYGIKLYAELSFLRMSRTLKAPFCPCDPKHMQMLDKYIDNATAAGVDGLVFMYDDINCLEINGKRVPDAMNHVATCSACSKKFANIAQMQESLTLKMVEKGEAAGLKDFIVCPTPYHTGDTFGKRYVGKIWNNYYEDFMRDPRLEKVKCFHCSFSPDEINALKRKGMRNYAYFINGFWPTDRWFSFYAGLPRLEHVWYGFQIGPSGPVPVPGALRNLKNIDKLTQCVFFGSSADDGLALGGIWAWWPEKYDSKKAREYVSEKLYGPMVFVPLSEYERNMIKLILFFRTYVNSCNSECKTKSVSEPFSLTNEELAVTLKKATSAYERIKQISPKMMELRKMRKAIDYFTKKIDIKMETELARKALIESYKRKLKTVERVNLVAYWSFNDPANIGVGGPAKDLDCEVLGHPTSTTGIIGDAIKLHGGVMSNTLGLRSGVVEYLKLKKAKPLNPGTGSLSVELWVNYKAPAYNQFIGTRRTNRPFYQSKGWSVGSGKPDGEIRFTVDDGKTTSSIAVSAKKLCLSFSGWTYIVAVRNARKKELRLYVNGKEFVAPVKDLTGDISTGKPLLIGYDYSTGSFMDGALDEIRVYKSVLLPKAIGTAK